MTGSSEGRKTARSGATATLSTTPSRSRVRAVRALITGVAGFIGSHLADRLLSEGHDVLGVDAFTGTYDIAQKRRNIEGALRQPRFRFVEADLKTRRSSRSSRARRWSSTRRRRPGCAPPGARSSRATRRTT